MKILCLEDNPEFTNILVPILEARGHEVRLCDNADEAVGELSKLNNYKLVLLDLMMMLGTIIRPEEAKETGIAIYKRLRKINTKIPIIVLTAQKKEDVWTEFRLDSKATYHGKPPNMSYLYKQIEEAK